MFLTKKQKEFETDLSILRSKLYIASGRLENASGDARKPLIDRIEVIKKDIHTMLLHKESKNNTGFCNRCHSYCWGDCSAN